jgi:hypothetical protein
MLRQEKSRPDAQTLSHALTIAWDLLAAADDPATARERADETRRQWRAISCAQPRRRIA